MQNSKSKNPQKSYTADWQHFTSWRKGNKHCPLPADVGTIGLYISELAETHKFSTLRRHLSSNSEAQCFKRHVSPTKSLEVQAILEGIKREIGSRQQSKKT